MQSILSEVMCNLAFITSFFFLYTMLIRTNHYVQKLPVEGQRFSSSRLSNFCMCTITAKNGAVNDRISPVCLASA